MDASQPTIVDSLSACRTAVSTLDMEKLLAVDSEGVHLSRTGPLTLLQVATSTGRVFLFDIRREPRMFKDGGLKRLLENEAIVKVLHSARNDADALYWQYGTELRNVHDTQVAHREMERSKGNRFPPRGRLGDVCAIYCPEKSSLVDAEKDIVGTKMNRTDGEYWWKRPLTQEMINYAASDVIALIPEMYTAQKRLLEEKGLMATFQSRVERELKAVKDSGEWDSLMKDDRDAIARTLKEAAGTLRTQRFQAITDKNVLEALSLLRLNEVTEMDLPPVIRDLKLQQMQVKLEEVERDMREKGKDYDSHGVCRQLHAFVSVLEGHPLKEQAQRVMSQVNQMILEDIRNKYTASTPAAHLAGYEKGILGRALRPKGEHDSSVSPVLLGLYWKVKLEDLKGMIKKFQDDPSKFQVSEGYVKLLKFYTSGDVPAGLKALGSGFLKTLQGLGKVSAPSQASGMRRGSAGGRFGRRY